MCASKLQAGILILVLSISGGCSRWQQETGVCDVCRRELHPATSYRIHLEDGQVKETCCPRCGLHFEEGRRDVARREVGDFRTGDLLDAESAFFVEGSSVHLCYVAARSRDRSGSQYALDWDRCLPSLVAFRSRPEAKSFQSHHGGTVRTFEELKSSGPSSIETVIGPTPAHPPASKSMPVQETDRKKD